MIISILQHLQATMGLYEGETSLYFMIAQGDSATVEWLLENNARYHNLISAFLHFLSIMNLFLSLSEICGLGRTQEHKLSINSWHTFTVLHIKYKSCTWVLVWAVYLHRPDQKFTGLFLRPRFVLKVLKAEGSTASPYHDRQLISVSNVQFAVISAFKTGFENRIASRGIVKSQSMFEFFNTFPQHH